MGKKVCPVFSLTGSDRPAAPPYNSGFVQKAHENTSWEKTI